MKMKIVNLRHLGGYVTSDGRRVKDNLIYRSGNLSIGNKKLEEKLNQLMIVSVYDLRSTLEAKKERYELPSNIKYNHYPILISLEGFFNNLNLDLTSSKEAFNLLENEDFMTDINKEMARHPEMFGNIIKDIIKWDGKAVLFHCSAGKDRTGVLSALILLSLGVSQNDIVENYLLSNEYRKEDIESEFERLDNSGMTFDEINKIKDMIIVKKEYLESFLKIVNEHGSFEDYVNEKLGLTSKEIEKLKELFLEQD